MPRHELSRRLRSILGIALLLAAAFASGALFGVRPASAAPSAVPLAQAVPVNDLCPGAIVIPPAGPFPHLTAVVDITNATTTSDPGVPTCQTSVSRSVWYSFTPPATGTFDFELCAPPTATTVSDTVMAIYTSVAGCAGPFTQIACNDDSGIACTGLRSSLRQALTGGTTYYIVVWQFGTSVPGPGLANVQLRVNPFVPPPPPTNDICAGAITLLLNRPQNGSLANGTNDYQLPAASTCFAGINQTVSTGPGRDVVYRFTAPATDTYSFRAQNLVAGGNLVLYLGTDCPTATPGVPVTVNTCVGAANRTSGTAAFTAAEEIYCVPLTLGQTVFLYVDEHTVTTTGGNFVVWVSTCRQEAESNNDPASANPYQCAIENSITAADIDFYSIGTPAAGARLFAMINTVFSTSTDSRLRVTTATDTLEFDDDDGDTIFGSLGSNVAGTPLLNVPSFLRVDHFSTTGIGQPWQTVMAIQPPGANPPSNTSATNETEPNDTTATANFASNNYFYGSLPANPTSGLPPSVDTDLYAFTAVAGDLIFLSLDGDPLRNATPINAALALLDASGTVLVTVNDGQGTSNVTPGTGSLTATTPSSPGEGLLYRVPVGGTFYARVIIGTTSTGTIGAGDYLLSISKNCGVGGGLTALPTADVSVVKTAPASVPSLNTLSFNITVNNSGPGSALNTTLTDNIPAGTTFQSVTTSRGSCTTPPIGGTGSVVCSLGTLGIESAVITLVVAVTAPQGSIVTNTATVSTTTTDPVPGNNNSTTNTTVTAPADSADMSVTKTDSPDPVLAGNNLTYLLTANNAGPAAASNVTVADTLPASVRFVSATPSAGGSCTTPPVGGSGTLSCTWAGLTAVGTSRTISLVVRVCSETACNTSISNTATVSSATNDVILGNNTAIQGTLVQNQADVAITKSAAPNPAVAGQNLVYTLVVSNSGPSSSLGTVVVDTLPAAFTFISALSTQGSCTRVGQVVTCNIGTVGPSTGGQCVVSPTSVTITITGQISPTAVSSIAPCTGPTLFNTATVSTANCLADPVLGNNTATTITQVRAGADVLVTSPQVTKIAGPAVPFLDVVADSPDQDQDCLSPGDVLEVIQSFSNTGPNAISLQRDNAGPEFIAELPGQVVGQGGSCEVQQGGGTCLITENEVTWNGSIPVGDTVTLRYVVRIRGGLATGTVLRFPAQVNYDPCNTGVNTASRLAAERTLALDCVPTADPNRQLGGQVHLPILNFQGQDDVCRTWIEVQYIGCDPSKAVLVTWGEPGFCPPQAAGPLKVECTGLLNPGSTWNLLGAQIPTGSKSGILFKFTAKQLSELPGDPGPTLADDFGFDDVAADLMCETLFFGVVGDSDDYRRFKKAYNEGLSFASIPQDTVAGEGVLAVEVLRHCPGDVTPGVEVSSRYNGIAAAHLGYYDPLFGGYGFYVPLIYAQKAGLNTVMYIQNGGLECSSVEIWFKAQDDCLRARICEIFTLAPGESYQWDANDCVGPDWQGSAWLRSSQSLGIAVDIFGRDILMTYNAEPAPYDYVTGFDEAGQPIGFETPTTGEHVAFGPLAYSEYQGWDTGIQVMNLSETQNAKVKAYFLDRSGDVITTLVDWICPRGSQTYFLPVIADLPGNWVGSVRVESQRWWAPGTTPSSTPPYIVGVATLTKYSDTARTETQEAIAYNLLPEHKSYTWQVGFAGGGRESGIGLIAIPSLLKDLDGTGTTSEIAITNLVAKPGFTDFAIFLYDQNGLLDFVCQKLHDRQVEYIDLQTWGYVNNGFKGSAIISATFWEHDVFDAEGFFLRNLVGLGAVGIERTGTRLGEDVPGDEAAGSRGIPFAQDDDMQACFGGSLPRCPGQPSGSSGPVGP